MIYSQEQHVRINLFAFLSECGSPVAASIVSVSMLENVVSQTFLQSVPFYKVVGEKQH